MKPKWDGAPSSFANVCRIRFVQLPVGGNAFRNK